MRPAKSATLTVNELTPGTASTACCISSNGTVLGESAGVFLYRNGVLTPYSNLPSNGCGPNPDGPPTVRAVNNQGEFIVITCLGTFLYQSETATLTPFGPPVNDFVPAATNNSGVLAGQIHPNVYPPVPDHAGTYANGQVTDLGGLTSYLNQTSASALNDSGEVVGTAYHLADFTTIHGFIHADGAMTDLGFLPGAAFTEPTAITGHGEVVGVSGPQDYFYTKQGFRYRGGTMTALGTLGGPYSSPLGVNDHGEIVGYSSLAGNTTETAADAKAFLYCKGRMIDLNTLLPPGSPWTLINAVGISNKGEIAALGFFNGDTTQTHALLLSLSDDGSGQSNGSGNGHGAEGDHCPVK